MIRRDFGVVAVLTLSMGLGCQTTCQRPCYTPTVSAGCATCNASPPLGPIAPIPSRTPVLQAPPGTTPPPIATRSYPPPQAPLPPPSWQAPADGQVQQSGARLQAPDLTAPAKPIVTEEAAPAAAFPVGIPQFASVKDQVASGQKPLLDGFDWLKANGFRTVLQIRRSGENDAADREQVEKRGLKFVSLEVSPKSLSKAAEEFDRVVGNKSNYPLFVYDKDGLLAGALWYLHFRTVDHLTDAEARTKARSLGLREELDGEQRDLWLAIQQYLRDLAR